MDINEKFSLPKGVEDIEEETEVEISEEVTDGNMEEPSFDVEKPRANRPPFAYWKVGDKMYKLKLKTQGIQQLESKYKRNLLGLLDTMPSLSVMLEVTHAAMQPWHSGVKLSHIQALFDKYQDEGGSQISFFKDVFIEIYKASGFFTSNMLESMASNSMEM